ncbi:MAG: bifunctional oligoribonuclease/PAP phosphatase NrnA [Lachnospiraceae bacterium]|nr:bifunctional oligoribonuclease/PAP phosphatase NrnA [Lachnospiraceae bacterium]
MFNLLEECKNAESIGISGHIRPDGDCVGSTLSLYLYLKKVYPGKKIQLFLEPLPDFYQCLKSIEEIRTSYETNIAKFDVFFAVDCGKDRLGKAETFFDQAVKKINIDHHISNTGTGDLNYIVPDASSASELVYDLIDPVYLDEDIAKTIYLGIIHDTGVFQYSNTSPKTLETAAKLIAFGFDFPKLIDETFYEKTYDQNRILGETIMNSRIFLNGACIAGIVSKEQMEHYHVGGKELDGIVNQLRITKGVECAIFLYELETGEYKASLRSNSKVNVSEIAGLFGGGGHIRAAGCSLKGTPEQILDQLVEQIGKQI